MRSSRAWRWVAAVLLGAWLALPAGVDAQQVRVTLMNGRVIEGELLEQSDQSVVVSEFGQRQVIERSRIKRIEGPGDAASVAVGEDDLAVAGESSRRLSPEQINLIKVFEIDFADRPSVQIPRDVLDTILDRYTQDAGLRGEAERRTFRGGRGVEQLRQIFELAQRFPEVRQFYGRIEVQRDPPALRTFRSQIHRGYVLNYCGTIGCHGGNEAGPFRLLNERPTSTETAYTNFYLLNAWPPNQRDGEQSARQEPGQRPPANQDPASEDEMAARPPAYRMIDRTQPERSLLIQYGLSPQEAVVSHPDVPGWRPRFRRATDRGVTDIIAWIDDLYRPAPDYLINFSLTLPQDEPALEGDMAAPPPAGEQRPTR